MTVNTIARRGSTASLIVAGTFSTAGSLACASICSFDTSTSTWSSLSTGLTGEVRAVDFAGGSAETLVAVGSFVLSSTGAPAFVAMYNFDNSSWMAMGAATAMPGPATAVAVDNRNSSNVFVAGLSSAGCAYLMRWDGASWQSTSKPNLESILRRNELILFDHPSDSSILTSSTITQLAFVPLSAALPSNSVIEADRVLLVSGALALTSFGSLSTALFDGQRWYPFIRSTASDGSAGSVAGIFASQSSFSFSIRNYLAQGIVVLIAIAIATGVVFLVALLGVLGNIAERRKDKSWYPIVVREYKDDSSIGKWNIHYLFWSESALTSLSTICRSLVQRCWGW